MSISETVVRRVINEIVEGKQKDEIYLQSATSGGANFSSSLLSVTIKSENEEDLKLFVKIGNIKEELRNVINLKYKFAVEQFVYSELAKTYDRIQERHSVPLEYRFTFPKYYGGDDTDGEETVVLEDLVSKRYTVYSRFQSIDWEHIKCAVKVLARFHALSFAFAKEEPENFAKALEKVKLQPNTRRDAPAMKEMRLKMVAALVQVVKEEDKERISKFLYCELSPEEKLQYKTPLSTPVLCHGDYRGSNLFYKEQDGKIEIMVVDYQTVHSGCPVMDLLFLEFMGTDEEFRRENHERMLDEYFTELTLALHRFDLNVNEVYPRETFNSELQQMLPVALRTASTILPLVLVEPDHAPQVQTASVGEFMIIPGQLFAERFSGLVSDCVRWGAL